MVLQPYKKNHVIPSCVLQNPNVLQVSTIKSAYFGTHLFGVIEKSAGHTPGQLAMDKNVQDKVVLLEQEVEPVDLQRPLPISTIQWFCGFSTCLLWMYLKDG